MGIVERLRVKWGVGLWGTIAILLAFALAGSTTVILKEPILGFLLPAGTSEGIQWLVYLVIIMPVYQVLLLGYGTLLGQGGFFWTKLKGIWGYLARATD